MFSFFAIQVLLAVELDRRALAISIFHPADFGIASDIGLGFSCLPQQRAQLAPPPDLLHFLNVTARPASRLAVLCVDPLELFAIPLRNDSPAPAIALLQSLSCRRIRFLRFRNRRHPRAPVQYGISCARVRASIVGWKSWVRYSRQER